MNLKAPPCPECGGNMRKLSGRAGKVNDEQWMCYSAIEERTVGWKGPRTHRGMVYDVAYILRSEENRAAIEREQIALQTEVASSKQDVAYAKMQAFAERWSGAKPGDCVIDRNFRKVYLIDKDGARRTITDFEAASTAIDEMKRQLDAAKKRMNHGQSDAGRSDAGDRYLGAGSPVDSNPVAGHDPVPA